MDHKTVGARRVELEDGGEIPHHATVVVTIAVARKALEESGEVCKLHTTTGKDGVTQPRAKPKPTKVEVARSWPFHIVKRPSVPDPAACGVFVVGALGPGPPPAD